MRCLAIIPAYNEGKNIYNVVKSAKSSSCNCDIIVINDCSSDNTYIQAKMAGVKVLNLSSNLGIGGAVQTGYLYAYDHNYDATSGYRMVNKRGIELFADYYPQDYHEVETIVYAARNGLRIKEIKVNMKKRQGGRSSITPIKSIYYAIKVTCALVL